MLGGRIRFGRCGGIVSFVWLCVFRRRIENGAGWLILSSEFADFQNTQGIIFVIDSNDRDR